MESKLTVLVVQEMTCGSCAHHVDNALKDVEGVETVEIRLREKKALVRHDGSTAIALMIEALREAGYESAPAE